MRIFTLALLLLSSLSIGAQSFSDGQKTLLTKRTASWCPNCGSWGWEFAKALEATENPNAILIRAHYSGDLKSQVAEELTANFDPIYQPEFYVNDERQVAGSNSWSSMVSEIDENINQNAEKSANFSFELDGSVEGSTISGSVDVNVLNDIDGEYYLAIYVLEDSVLNDQAGLPGDVVHNSVLRWSLSGASFGAQVFNGPANAGSGTSLSYSTTYDDTDLEDRYFKLLAIVWQKVDGKYLVDNLHFNEVGATSFVEKIETVDHNFTSHVVDSKVLLSFSLERELKAAKVQFLSLDGRLLDTFTFSARQGRNEVSRFLNNTLPQIVLVTISSEEGLLLTEKVVIR